MMKIYTRTGDKGYTSLIGGTRVRKSDLRIESYGTVDELNAFTGLIRDQDIDQASRDFLKTIQDTLFVIGSALAADPERSRMELPELEAGHVTAIETRIDRMNEILPELKHFILPGGNSAISYCHVARCVCRRAERIIVELAGESEVDERIIVYLNRLSDYFFVLGRYIGHQQNIAENIWIPSQKRPNE